MKYQIQIHFDSKGSCAFDKEFSTLNDLENWLSFHLKLKDKFIMMQNGDTPFIVNMENVIAITSHLPEEKKEIESL